MYANSTVGYVGYSTGENAAATAATSTSAEDELSWRRPKPVFFWSNGEVMKWLKRHCEEYYQLYGSLFLEHEITGRSLIRINEHTLQRMGVEDGQHRDQLARIILKLRLKSDIIELKDLERKGQPVAGGGNESATTNSTTTSNQSRPSSVKSPLLSSFHR